VKIGGLVNFVVVIFVVVFVVFVVAGCIVYVLGVVVSFIVVFLYCVCALFLCNVCYLFVVLLYYGHRVRAQYIYIYISSRPATVNQEMAAVRVDLVPLQPQ
jgi:hypothetical protein